MCTCSSRWPDTLGPDLTRYAGYQVNLHQRHVHLQQQVVGVAEHELAPRSVPRPATRERERALP